MYIHEREKNCHGGARQASNPWTAAVSSLLALISREYTTCLAHHQVYIHKVNHNACGSVIIQNVGSGSYIATLATGDRAHIYMYMYI